MTAGLSQTNIVDVWLNLIRGTNATAPTNIFFKVHTGDPGASGTANASAVTTRSQGTYAAPATASGRAIALTGTKPTFTATGSETWSHVSAWDASTAGNFLFSIPLAASKAVVATDVMTLDTATITIPTAAIAA